VSSRLKLALIGAVCAAPLVLGTLAYWFGWGTGSPGNYGELLEPRPLSGNPIATLRGKWVLVTFDAAACNASCERKLYFVRQVRKAQGKEMDRVERLWILTDGAQPRAEALAATEGSRAAHADARFVAQFPGNPLDHIYLVDPLGNLMMRFPPEPQPKKVIKDLERLLKYSGAG
jgi:hypothetical protein